MSYPTSRTTLFIGRLTSMILSIFTIILFGWLGLLIGVLKSDSLDFSGGQLILPYYSVFAVTLFFATFALFLSLIMPSRSSAAMTTGILVLAGFIVTSLSAAIPDLKSFAMFSPITYFQANAMNGLNILPVVGLLMCSTTLSILACLKFKARDLRIIGESGWSI
ncbi:MAG: ABC transporter permease subunit [Limisphaerales bacterium]